MKTFSIEPDPVIREIITTVAMSCNTTTEFIQSRCRRRYLAAYPRMLCFLFAKAFTEYSLAEIGYVVSDKDHSTAIHGIKTIATLIVNRDMAVYEMYEACRIRLTAGNLDRIMKLHEIMTYFKKLYYVNN